MRTLSVAALALLLAHSPAAAEWRVAGAVGTAVTRGSDLSISQGNSSFTVDNVHWSERSFMPAVHYDVRMEYYSPGRPGWGYFVELNHMKIHAQVGDTRHIHGVIDGVPIDTVEQMGSVVEKFNIAHGVNFIGLGVIYRMRRGIDEQNPNGRVQPYFGFSVGPIVNHPDSVVMGRRQYGPFIAGPHWGGQVMAGTHYALSRSWGVFTEAKLTHVEDRVPIGGGHASMTLDSFHLNTGLTLTF